MQFLFIYIESANKTSFNLCSVTLFFILLCKDIYIHTTKPVGKKKGFLRLHILSKCTPLSPPFPCWWRASIEVFTSWYVSCSSIRIKLPGAIGALLVVGIFWRGWRCYVSNATPCFLNFCTFLGIPYGLDETLSLFSPITILFLQLKTEFKR